MSARDLSHSQDTNYGDQPYTAYDELRSFFEQIDDLTMIRHCLGSYIYDAPPLAQHVITNVIDTEIYDKNGKQRLTELGIVPFDSRDMGRLAELGEHGENYLRNLYYYHYRLAENAHLGFKKTREGKPATNRFGQTRFVTEQQARLLLENTFAWDIDPQRPELGKCPVVLIGHGIHIDIQRLQKALGTDIYGLETMVRIIDIQNLACISGLNPGDANIGLKTLSLRCGFAYRDPNTACNDAAYTAIAAVMMGLEYVLYANEPPLPSKTPQAVLDELEAHSQSMTANGWGTTTFCTRCDSTAHTVDQCRVPVFCNICAARGRGRVAHSHRTAKCFHC
ncbi:hypothetical protein BDV96DRAFT_657137 [Lophiotrema nucula]|uniref:Gfd2/YDR514C-like C-terminal domain-containing protein n=1 Tax=Lophiotrema nucula TaxID=690887 RepID=A0A6A5ZFF7_9PLEO|nr:hypothetical protein BDV96DRAFT_657137 [Lophiotrema nucula]